MFDRVPEKQWDAVGTQSGTQSANHPTRQCVPSPPSRGDADAVVGDTPRGHTKKKDSSASPNTPRKWTPPAPRKSFPVADGWHLKASCRGIDVELFYPDQPGLRTPGSRNPANHTVDVIHSMCRSCPVRVDCLNSALNEREEHAIRAGVEFNQRHHRQWAYRVAVAHSKQPDLARLTHHLDNPPKGRHAL
jgi:hypothetical protein